MSKLGVWLCTLLLIPLMAAVSPAATVASWDFTRETGGWRDEAGSQPQTTPQGILWTGSDQGLSLRSPGLDIATQAFQVIEITLSTRLNGPAHLVWQGDDHNGAPTGWQGALPVQAPPDGQPHTLRLLPLWQNLKKITALRLIGPPGLQLRLQSLRIVGQDLPVTEQARWQFEEPADAGQWRPLLGTALVRREAEGAAVQLVDPEVMLASPPLQVMTYRHEWLSVELTSRRPHQARLQWATTAQRGLSGPAIALRQDRHTYNVRVSEQPGWNGTLAGLALNFDAPAPSAMQAATINQPAEIVIHKVALSNAPQGPADLRTTFVGPMDPRVEVDRTFRLVWVLQNDGGDEAQRIRLTATSDDPISIPTGTTVIERLPHGMPEAVTWLVKASGPGVVRLRAEYDGAAVNEEVRVEPVAPAEAPDARVRSGATGGDTPPVLAHYHVPPPAQFGPAMLDRLLYRRPWLGDYDLQPEVMDWQARWALEHGIDGFILDVRRGEAAALDTFLSSRAARQMKLVLRWTEPIPTADAGRTLLEQVRPIMSLPGYLRHGGRPLLLVGHALQRTREGWGLSDLLALTDEGQAALVACLPLNMASPELLAQAGYVAAASLHVEQLLPSSQPVLEAWEEAAQAKTPHVLSLQPAWQGDLTPERLGMLLRIALMRAKRADSLALPCVIAGDWNGEQGLEPRRPEGTRWLEAVAAATGTPAPARLVLPSDAGMGPYDRARPAPPRAWEFDSKETWNSAMGMSVLRVSGGQMTGRTDSAQPAIFGGDTMLDTRPFKTVLIALSASAGKQARLWWRTSLRKFTVEHSLPFDIVADGAVHEYRLDVSEAEGWEGYLEGLRLDPTDVADAAVAIDYIRIVP